MQKWEQTIEKDIAKANRVCDDAMHSLFQITYYIGKKVIFFHKFPDLYSLFIEVKTNMTEKIYHGEKNCCKILSHISLVVQNKMLHRIRDSRFFGIIIDESTDVFVTNHLVVFVGFVKKSFFVFFLDCCMLKRKIKMHV
jgi:hypothetical protein